MKVENNFFEIYLCEPGDTVNGRMIVDDIVGLINETKKRDPRFEKYKRYVIGLINTIPNKCLIPNSAGVSMEQLLESSKYVIDAFVQSFLDDSCVKIIAIQAMPYINTPELDKLYRSSKHYHEMTEEEKKLFDDGLESSIKMMEDAGFKSINNFSNFEISEAMVYKNLFGIAISRTADQLVEEHKTAKKNLWSI